VALNPEDHNSASFNALDWIDTFSDRALIDIQAVVGWLCGETPGERYDDYFKHAARALLGCLLADIVFDPALPPERKTLTLLRQRVALPIPELKELLEAIYAKGSSYGFGFPAQLAGNLAIGRQPERHHRKAVLRLLWRSWQCHFLARYPVPRPPGLWLRLQDPPRTLRQIRCLHQSAAQGPTIESASRPRHPRRPA
jgi:Type IV secretory system Conjugative DNA transfer